MRVEVRREAGAVAAVIVAVVGVLAPLTLGGRLASSADLTAFYAPFATFLHDRLAAGDLPFWAPGAFRQPFLGDAQSGVTYPPMLLASWLLDPIDALRAEATFHYLIAALGTSMRSRGNWAHGRPASAFGAIAFAASGHLVARSAALGLLGGAAWLAPALALAEASATARPSRRHARHGRARARARVPSRERLPAARRAHACWSSAIWLIARAGKRGLSHAASRSPLALASPRGADAAARDACATRRPRATSTRTGSARSSSATAARWCGFGVSRSGDRDALPRRRHARAGVHRLAPRRP